ncbi:hypothetical protein [Pseudomonas sp. WSY_20]|uniref:hypothetical protein n=1 Tax=Pseudomonas sp. WSY_20 TaxID=3367212 RepID=UPI00370B145B
MITDRISRLLLDVKLVLLINKLCHKTSGNSRPSGEVDPVEAKLKVVTKHRFSKNLGGFRLIKVVTTITVVTAKVQPEKNRRGTPRKKPEKIMMVSFVLGTETVELEN